MVTEKKSLINWSLVRILTQLSDHDNLKPDESGPTQLTFTWSKSTTEILEKGVKYVQS